MEKNAHHTVFIQNFKMVLMSFVQIHLLLDALKAFWLSEKINLIISLI